MVIDGNPNRGSQLAGSLRALGYETVLETSGDQGFRAAADSADVELVVVSHAQAHGAWNLIDILTNLKSDARTAKLPVYIYGPLKLERDRSSLLASFPAARFLVQPIDAAILESLLGGRPAKLSDADRAGYASEAASLLARIAGQPKSPYAADLSASEPALTIALNQPETSLAASTALGDVPNPDAQQSLADVVLDPSRPVELRRAQCLSARTEHPAIRPARFGRSGSSARRRIPGGSRSAAPRRAGNGHRRSAGPVADPQAQLTSTVRGSSSAPRNPQP